VATVLVHVRNIKLDKRQHLFVHGEDVDTGQYVTVYAKRGLESVIFSAKAQKRMAGKDVQFDGTIHNIGENPKLIATKATVVG